MLHNFGGNVSMRGNLKTVATAPSEALNDSKSGNMVGIGLTPEAIEQNPVMYELMLENVWNRQPVDVHSWLNDYMNRRYGKENDDALKAWAILSNTVYASDNQNDGSQNVITSRPTLQRGTPKHEYRSEALLPAWTLMIKASSDLQQSDGFRYDLVDLTRQVLVNYADTLHSAIASAYAKGDKGNLEKLTGDFLSLLDDLDDLLATRKDFLLGSWIGSAKRCGHTEDEKMLYEKNARDQITLWGGEKSVLHDYACKQWAGLMKDFYKQRWQIFFDAVKQSALVNEKPAFDNINQQIASFEWQWVNQTTPVYPEVPQGNSVEMAKKLFHKYQPVLERTYGITRE
jgi:Alpha-N-acetylglucosaminidase (NAGLU).